ncbi:MAG: hypothetical protein IJH32_00785 [Ruminococcus sp.]|nr:hypothetical protein [Ruminococcus sp.]
MFRNIGQKIKGLAIFLTIIGIIASLVIGISTIVNAGKYAEYGNNGAPSIVIGILEIVAGSILSWLSSFVLYGFGQLVESAQNIERRLTGTTGDDEDIRIKADINYLSTTENNPRSESAEITETHDTEFIDDGIKTGLVFTEGLLTCAFCGKEIEPGDSKCPKCHKTIDWNAVTKQ